MINHGDWVVYVPDPLPEGAPMNAMFAQRMGDGMDWYQYIHGTDVFIPTSAKCTVAWNDYYSEYMIRAPNIDPTCLFPDSATVVELDDQDYSAYTSIELINLLVSKFIDMETGEVTTPPVAPTIITPPVTGQLLERIYKLEQAIFGPRS